MRIGIRKAHTKNCYGATGYIDEWVESRNLFPKVVELLKPYHTIVDCTPDESLGWGEWNTGVNTAVHDAVFAYEMNSKNDAYSNNAENKRSNIKEKRMGPL